VPDLILEEPAPEPVAVAASAKSSKARNGDG